MKYLIQHTKEFIITLGVFVSVAMVIAWVITAICKGDFSYEHMIAVVGALFEMLGWYYNMPTSEENAEHTGAMRLEKMQNSGIIDGEDFMDEYDEDEDGEPLDEDEENTEELDDGADDFIEDGDING